MYYMQTVLPRRAKRRRQPDADAAKAVMKLPKRKGEEGRADGRHHRRERRRRSADET